MGIAEFWRSMAIEIPCRSLGRLKSGVAVMPSTCSARLATSPCPRAQAVVEFRQKCCFRDSIATSQLVMGSQGVLARMCARWHHSRRRHSHQARRRHHSRRRHSHQARRRHLPRPWSLQCSWWSRTKLNVCQTLSHNLSFGLGYGSWRVSLTVRIAP